MDIDLQIIDEGYVARVTGRLGIENAMPFWEAIQEHRPEGGYAFGIVDIRDGETPLLDRWPPEQDAYEVLQPAVRLLRQTLRPGFRFGFVTQHRYAQAMMDDLAELTRLDSLRTKSDEQQGRRFDDLETALAWCRGEADG